MSGKSTAAISLVVMIIIIVFAFGFIYAAQQHDVDLMNQGCEPITWNQFGVVSLWSCPAGVIP
jgi:hypothetical protein